VAGKGKGREDEHGGPAEMGKGPRKKKEKKSRKEKSWGEMYLTVQGPWGKMKRARWLTMTFIKLKHRQGKRGKGVDVWKKGRKEPMGMRDAEEKSEDHAIVDISGEGVCVPQ